MTQAPWIRAVSLSCLLSCSADTEKSQTDQTDVFNADTPTDTGTAPAEDSGTPDDTGEHHHADTGTQSDTGTEDGPEIEIDGVYEGELYVTLAADPLGTGVTIEETCTGTVLVNVMQVGDPPIYGDGECHIPEDGILALLVGSTGPFVGRTSGTISEEGTPSGTIILELPGGVEELHVDWTGRFEEVYGTPQLTGEYAGLVEDLVMDMETGPLTFDVTYSGHFEMVQTRTP